MTAGQVYTRDITDVDLDAVAPQLERTWAPARGLIGFVSEVDHKRIGLRFIFTALLIGARTIALPRLAAFGYWMFLAGGVFLYVSFFLNIGPDIGWFSYVPLAGPEFAPGKRADTWAQLITFTEVASLVGAIVTIVTIFKYRRPGMTLDRLPLFA